MSSVPFPRGGGDPVGGPADGKKEKKKPVAATNDEVRNITFTALWLLIRD